MTNMLGQAIAIAAVAHEGKTDRGGKAYILHPLKVMNSLQTEDEELQCIAIMHDVIEDSPMTLDALKALGFSKRVLSALELLTHKVDTDLTPEKDYGEYIKKIASNRDAILVKLADLRDNSDITRLKGLRDKDFARLQKYHRSWLYLKSVLETMEHCGL